MTSWSSYQSLIQLGAALNFGFAGFDFLFARRLVQVQKVRSDRMAELVKARKDGVARPPISGAVNARIKDRIASLERFERAVADRNAVASVLTGCVAIGILAFMSIRADDPPNVPLLVIFTVLTYGWLAVSIAWMLGARLYLRIFVTRLVGGVRR